MTDAPPLLQQEKQRLRALMQALRAAKAAENPNACNELFGVLADRLKLEGREIIASYAPFRDEIDPGPLNRSLRAYGHKIALPVVTGKDQALIFRLHAPGDRVILNATGIAEPGPDAPAVEPDILLIPLLAFDARRNRLGYGGGFYDRTLTELRARKHIFAIGIGYSFQEVVHVPTGPNDAVLDMVLTEIKAF